MNVAFKNGSQPFLNFFCLDLPVLTLLKKNKDNTSFSCGNNFGHVFSLK